MGKTVSTIDYYLSLISGPEPYRIANFTKETQPQAKAEPAPKPKDEFIRDEETITREYHSLIKIV